MRDEATTVVARDSHSEINNVEESHLLILPLIGERSLHSFVDSFATAADDEGRAERKKKRRKKKHEEKGARKERRAEKKGERATGGNAGLVEHDLTLMKTIYGAL